MFCVKGCGNPICVILDKKPVRFTSICQFINYLCNNNRQKQVNFIQKGDCYDISKSPVISVSKTFTEPLTVNIRSSDIAGSFQIRFLESRVVSASPQELTARGSLTTTPRTL